MINDLLQVVLSFFIKIISFILNIILLPLTLLINGLFPGISNFFGMFDNLFNNQLVPGLRFAREVLLNLLCLNRNLIGIIAVIPLTYFAFTMANLSIRFLISIYRLWKKGEAN